jgi:integrase/recombinase XerD
MGHLDDYINHAESSKGIKESTRKAYRKDIADFLRFLTEKNNIHLNLVSPAVIADYFLRLKENGKSLLTINRHKQSIKGFFDYLITREIVRENPVRAIKKIKMSKTISRLAVSEMNKLLSSAAETENERNVAILELLYASGVRGGELLTLKERDLDFRFMNTLSVKSSSGEPRLIPIGKKARDAVLEYLKVKKFRNETLFISNRGEGLSRQYLWEIVSRAAGNAGIKKKVTPQTFRDSFALHMLENGADAGVIKELMGFQSAWSMEGYLSLVKNRTKEVYDRCHPRA